MLDGLIGGLSCLDDVLWTYIGVPALVMLGLVLTLRSRAFQVRRMSAVFRNFWTLLRADHSDAEGVHPIKAFFASVGGAIGLGNIVAVCTAVQIGGPGALFWIWVTALLGMLLKYSEIFLGLRYRCPNAQGGYDGGPMYFLQRAFRSSWVAKITCILLCIYGVEVYMFGVVATSISRNFEINRLLVVTVLFCAVMFVAGGGVKRVADVCSAIIPFFMIIFMCMSSWVLFANLSAIPAVLMDVFSSAFSGHAAVGGFAGSSLLLTITQGVKRGCYTGDVGIGYASVIHSESATQSPNKQAALGIFGIVLDTFVICTFSILLILVTDAWKADISAELVVQSVLADYFPGVNIFMPLFLFLLGYSTMIAYLVVGFKCADFLSPKWGRSVYYLYASVAFLTFSFVDSTEALLVMSITGGLLLVINSVGMFILRNEVDFELD